MAVIIAAVRECRVTIASRKTSFQAPKCDTPSAISTRDSQVPVITDSPRNASRDVTQQEWAS
jgi:hypothetical protein